ncbi:nicotinate-nucleotide adenylyltransferase [Noviherbaspirillum aridicola]|uniref:Probable nicotinate-nucleotide adenylyltransferase n=1 Tax=Noviherbaspirillum aridicola TaxID=2849687 RepID=A0ABQ4Q2E0_9BURK|nr:nicotinate-nucleotide adenylyltransferase [Noviherbaspirillum aridicola]GIZ51346.1 putative nicotinate-nucleotide adenylyltransferase [Noviherbaspirillum aridicola]
MGVTRCIALLGGSFDPVHSGHVALAGYFAKLLFPDELRLLPAGLPYQKQALTASAAQRIDMLRLAFGGFAVPVAIDDQEIRREGATYTIDTLRALRAQLGDDVSLAFLIGADQLQKLHTWKDWRALFDHAHICAASRPGFALDPAHVAPEVAQEFMRRAATPGQIRSTPAGLAYLAVNLAIDISATQIRAALAEGRSVASLIPAGVLDYIERQHLYQKN